MLWFSLENLAVEPVWRHVSSAFLAKRVKILNECRETPAVKSRVSWEAPKQVEFPKPWGRVAGQGTRRGEAAQTPLCSRDSTAAWSHTQGRN